MRKAKPYQVRNCYSLKPDEAKQVGNRCYACDKLADLYIEAGEAPDTGKDIVWKYTMFLCSWCVKIHDIEVTPLGAATGETKEFESEETPEMHSGYPPGYPLWSGP